MRLKILSDDEIDALYGRPRFTQEERVEYFTLSAQEKVALAQLHSLKSKVFFILQLGYFCTYMYCTDPSAFNTSAIRLPPSRRRRRTARRPAGCFSFLA